MSEYETNDQELNASESPASEPVAEPTPEAVVQPIAEVAPDKEGVESQGEVMARIPELGSTPSEISPIARRRRERRRKSAGPPVGLLVGGGLVAIALVVAAFYGFVTSQDSDVANSDELLQWTFDTPAPNVDAAPRWTADSGDEPNVPSSVLSQSANPEAPFGLTEGQAWPEAAPNGTVYESTAQAAATYPAYGSSYPTVDSTAGAEMPRYQPPYQQPQRSVTPPGIASAPSASDSGTQTLYWGNSAQPAAATSTQHQEPIVNSGRSYAEQGTYRPAPSYQAYPTQTPSGNYYNPATAPSRVVAPKIASRYASDPNSVHNSRTSGYNTPRTTQPTYPTNQPGAISNPYATGQAAPATTYGAPRTSYSVPSGQGYPNSNVYPTSPAPSATMPNYSAGASYPSSTPSVARFNGGIERPTAGNPYDRARSSLY